MGLGERIALYRQLEATRRRPLIVYVTSTRRNVLGLIDEDAIAQLQDQMAAIADSERTVDLLIASHGGDPMVAWRMMSILRERFDHVAVLVPHVAFSAATLLALGADEIIMHPHGNLGPVDMQLELLFVDPQTGQRQQEWFGYEDLEGLVEFAKSGIGLTGEAGRQSVFERLADQIGVIELGRAQRVSNLSMEMAAKLLRMHAADGADGALEQDIAKHLSKSFAHHGYPVSRREARELGLPVAEALPDVEGVLRLIWLDIEAELELRTPFSFLSEVARRPEAQALFDPVPVANFPVGLPDDILAQAYEQILEQAVHRHLAPVEVRQIITVMESARLATRQVDVAKVFVSRTPDLQLRVRPVTIGLAWEELPVVAALSEGRALRSVDAKSSHAVDGANGVGPAGVAVTDSRLQPAASPTDGFPQTIAAPARRMDSSRDAGTEDGVTRVSPGPSTGRRRKPGSSGKRLRLGDTAPGMVSLGRDQELKVENGHSPQSDQPSS